MQKCRYSINGKCTNENVACEKCNSEDFEMRACTPFQRCIALHNDNWAIEVEEQKEEQNNKLETKVVDFTINATGGYCIKYSDGSSSVICKEQLIEKLNQMN